MPLVSGPDGDECLEGQAGSRQNLEQKKYRPVFPGFLVSAVLIVLVCFAGVQMWQWFSSRLVDIQPLTKDTLVQEVAARAVLVKRETPVKAPASGNVKMLVKEGDRLRLGSAIARITGVNGSVTVYSPGTGLLCMHVDGLEGTLRPENINVLDMKTIEKIGIPDKVQPAAGKVEKGVPFCKLVDNLQPLLLYLKLDEKTNIEELNKRKVMNLIWNGERISGNVLETRSGDGNGFLLRIPDYPEELLHLRQVDVRVIINELEGYPVPYDALVFRDNRAGIFAVERNFVKWVPVEIAGHLNGKVVLKGNGSGVNTRYITNPDRVKEGSRVDW